MIAYFDTSAVVPLLIDEPGTGAAGVAWDAAGRLVSVRLVLVEARAALAQAERVQRISANNANRAAAALEVLIDQIEFVEVDDPLVRSAAELAATHGLRAYDAVHLAAALRVRDPELVVVAGDGALLAAATTEGLTIASTS